MRKKGTTVEWTTKLVRQVAELRGKGYKAAEIAEMTGLSYGSVRGKLQELVAAGEVPKHCATARRYTPTDVRDRKIRTLTDHVLDWVWEHPGYIFQVAYRYYVSDTPEATFSMHSFHRDGIVRYISVDGNSYWSSIQPCTEDNLRTLLAALRRIDVEAGNNG